MSVQLSTTTDGSEGPIWLHMSCISEEARRQTSSDAFAGIIRRVLRDRALVHGDPESLHVSL